MDRLALLLETVLPALLIGGGFGYVLGRVERRERLRAGTSQRR